jgi:uncharacterized membrane protein
VVVERDPMPPVVDTSARSVPEALPEHVSQNIVAMVAFQERESEKLGATERRLACLSELIGRPLYLIVLMLGVTLWVSGSLLAGSLGFVSADPPPFHGLHVLLTLAALLTTSVILLTQNRQAKIEKQRAHLDLQVNLLTEQKVTTLIRLLEELRRDLPMVRNRHDAEADSLQQNTDTAQVLSALATADAGEPPATHP